MHRLEDVTEVHVLSPQLIAVWQGQGHQWDPGTAAASTHPLGCVETDSNAGPASVEAVDTLLKVCIGGKGGEPGAGAGSLTVPDGRPLQVVGEEPALKPGFTAPRATRVLLLCPLLEMAVTMRQ